jgi:SAM-dependent methyltransferase
MALVSIDFEALLHEQREYYDARAGEYDDAYRRTGSHDRGQHVNAEWRAEMAQVSRAFAGVPLSGDVVELAAGTGYWTQQIFERVSSLTVIDGSAEMLAVNRDRLGPRADTIDYQVLDLFDWTPARTWDACVFGFWLCHVPDELLSTFLQRVHASLRPAGTVVFIDKAVARDEPEAPVERALDDGRRFTIVDHARPVERLRDAFAVAGMDVEVDTFGARFCLGRGRRP